MKIPYHGKLKLFWCKNCNVPVLGSRCARCDGEAVKVAITPPGDIRPAFEGDIKLINDTVKKQFGFEIIPEGKIVLLNSAPGYDRFDEIIMDGGVIGVLNYDVKKTNYTFLPRLFGARMLGVDKSRMGFVEIAEDALPYILKGASVLMPGVVDFDGEIAKGDDVIVICKGGVIGVGSARLSGKEAKGQKKGMFVKIRRHALEEKSSMLLGGQDWEDVLDANRKIIREYEHEAIEFVRKTSASYPEIPPTVAFSGGKDSLATLLIVKKVITDVTVIFSDTGIEFPSTVEYIKKFVKKLGLPLIEESAGDGFWKGVEFFGPPGRDYRWCCKICKLGPATRLIFKNFPKGCLTFIGQRKYESETRAKSGRIWRTPWIPIQMSAGPIQNWTALHVWLYIMREGAEVNELYYEGMERIGCWTCPASDLSELETLKKLHPDLSKKWNSYLSESGITDDGIKYGLWRWKKPSGAAEMLAGELGIKSKRGKRKKSAIKKFDYERSASMARMLGEVRTFDTFFSVKEARVLKDGTIETKSLSLNPRLTSIVNRASNCFGCGICLGQCKAGAIEFRDDKSWITDKCTGCMKCHDMCPIVKYG